MVHPIAKGYFRLKRVLLVSKGYFRFQIFQNFTKNESVLKKNCSRAKNRDFKRNFRFKKVLTVGKWYFRFQNFVLNFNSFSKMYLNAQNREFQEYFRSEEVLPVSNVSKFCFKSKSVFKKCSKAQKREF